MREPMFDFIKLIAQPNKFAVLCFTLMKMKMFCTFFIVIVIANCCGGQQDTNWSDYDIVSDIKCIPILECPEAIQILRHKTISAAKAEYLRSIKCADGVRYPMVWCSIIRPNVTSEASTETKNTTSIVEVDSRIVDVERPAFLPSIEECGYTDTDTKIQGGEDANMGEFPWMAWLEYRTRDLKLSGKCAGTLITNRYVLSAAHCVQISASTGKLESVLLGEYDTMNETDCIPNQFTGLENCADSPKRYEIEESTIHPSYNITSYHHDIALLRLVEVVIYTTYIQPICLPEPREDINIGVFTVAGWGRTETGQPSRVLQKLRLPRFDTTQCVRDLSYNVTNYQVCAGGERNKDSCKGDSGGPLMYISSRDNLWTQMGIISIRIGNRCGVGLPAIYTDVQKYTQWIYKTLRP